MGSPSTSARVLASGSLNEITQTEDGHPIDFELYTPLTKDNLSAVETLHERIGETIRVTFGTPENVVIKIVDDKSVMFTHFIPDSDSVTSGDDIGVWTDNPVFLKLANELVQFASARSMSFDSAKNMLGDDKVRPPRFDIIQDPKELRKVAMQFLGQTHECAMAVRFNDLKLGFDHITPREQERLADQVDSLRIVTDAREEDILSLPWTGRAEIRRVASLPARFAVFDNRVIRAYGVDPEDVSPLQHLGNINIVTNLPSAMAEARDHFEHLWESGTPVEIPEEQIEANRQRSAEARQETEAEGRVMRPRA